MDQVIGIVLPVFGLIGIGYAIAWSGVLRNETGEALADFVFVVAIPVLIFRTLAVADFAGAAPGRLWLAYFTGFGATRRIVLYDTLLDKFTDDEIAVVLAHEVGHWKRNHIYRGMALGLGAMLLGLILYARYINRIGWVNRFALAIYVGYYAAIEMMQKLQGEVLPQSADTIVPLTQHWGNLYQWTAMIITLVGVLAVLVYFFFSAEHKGLVGGVSKVGVWFLMVSFGAAFGYTIMGRISILIGRVVFLIDSWLGLG